MAYTTQQMVDMTLEGIVELTTGGQEYTIVGSRTVKRAELSTLQDQLIFWENRLAAESGRQSRTLADFSGGY